MYETIAKPTARPLPRFDRLDDRRDLHKIRARTCDDVNQEGTHSVIPPTFIARLRGVTRKLDRHPTDFDQFIKGNWCTSALFNRSNEGSRPSVLALILSPQSLLLESGPTK